MAEQPIKYSDLIEPDDSIEKLVKQLDEANQAYNNLAGSIHQEAQRISAAMVTISGATTQGRAATRGYSQDAEKLLKAERDLNFARSETARKIAELNLMKKQEQTITKLTVQLNQAEEGSYEALSAQYALNKVRLNAMTEAERKNTEIGRKLEAETRDIYDRMNELQKATGKYTLEVGNYEKAVGQLLGAQSRWFTNLQQIQGFFAGGLSQGIQAAGQAVATFGKQLLAMLANPIVAAIAAITAGFLALKEAISSSEENTMALERILSPFQRVLTGVLNVLQEVASVILRVVEGFEMTAMAVSKFAERLPLVGNALHKVNAALEENIKLTKEKQALDKLGRSNTVQDAKLAAQAAQIRKQAATEDDPKKKAVLLKRVDNIEKARATHEYNYAVRQYNLAKKVAAQSQNDAKANEDLAQKEAAMYRAKEQYYTRTTKLAKQMSNAERQAAKGGGGGSAKMDTSFEDEAKKRQTIERQLEDMTLANMEESYNKQRMIVLTSYQRQIEDLQEKMQKEVQFRELYAQQIEQLEIARDVKLSEITQKEADEIQKNEKEKADRLRKLAEDKKKMQEQVLRQQIDAADKEADLRDLQIENMEASEREKTRLRLEAEKDRIKKIYDLNVKAGKDLNSLEMKMLQEMLNNIDVQLTKNKPKDIYDLLGFNLSDEKKEAINTTLEYALGAVNQYMDAWVEAANKKVELADKEVDSAQKVLEAEIQARNEGYANNVEMAQKELEAAKKNQEKALKEQASAQRAQELINSAEQVSNLITASSLIWRQLGFPWAIPALAVMWGSFAAAKVKAMDAAKVSSETYGEGTVELLEGGSHQSGNDIDLGRKKDGTRRRAEGGEFFAVINKRSSRRYRNIIPDVVHSLNDGTFADKYMQAFPAVGGTVVVNHNTDLRELQDDVREIRKQSSRRVYIDQDGNIIEEYKNLRRKIKGS